MSQFDDLHPTTGRALDPHELVRQIGRMTLLGISGGRVKVEGENCVSLPVGCGYHVFVWLDADDTYRVEQVFKRSGKRFVKQTWTGVFCDEISDAAYAASCFR